MDIHISLLQPSPFPFTSSPAIIFNPDQYVRTTPQNLGLTEKEALIYLASLELGPSTVQDLSRKTGIIRTTAYNLIKSLEEEGLMVELLKGRKRLFASQSLERLLSHLQVQKKELEEGIKGHPLKGELREKIPHLPKSSPFLLCLSLCISTASCSPLFAPVTSSLVGSGQYLTRTSHPSGSRRIVRT